MSESMVAHKIALAFLDRALLGFSSAGVLISKGDAQVVLRKFFELALADAVGSGPRPGVFTVFGLWIADAFPDLDGDKVAKVIEEAVLGEIGGESWPK